MAVVLVSLLRKTSHDEGLLPFSIYFRYSIGLLTHRNYQLEPLIFFTSTSCETYDPTSLLLVYHSPGARLGFKPHRILTDVYTGVLNMSLLATRATPALISGDFERRAGTPLTLSLSENVRA